MITPRFDIEQDDEFLNIKVSINNIRFSASGVEININENVLIFHLSPYYLRLRFDHNLVDDERATANFIPGEGKILIKAPKANKGEIFEDLDLHSKLLARVNIGDSIGEENKTQGSLIQEIGGSTSGPEKIEDISKLGQNFDWEIEQVEEAPENEDLLNNASKYGFNNDYSGLIGVSISNGNDINDLNDPEHTNSIDRVKQRIQRENNVFDDEYYASEYITYKHGNEEDLDINRIKNIMAFEPKIIQDYKKWTNEQPANRDAIMPVEFTETEKNQMENNLPKKQSYLLDGETIKLNYITILNLLFSFNFENQENEGDNTSESVWTIGKLTPQIAGLDQQLAIPESHKETKETEEILIREVKDAPNDNENTKKAPESIIKTAIVAGIRRSLCFPLHRNYDLSLKAWENAFYTLKGGKRLVIKTLLAIHELFRFHDIYYVYNKCLLDDLCAWFISQGNETVIRSLALELQQQLVALTKNDVEFECLADVDMETGETSSEQVTIQELEILSEQMYNENITSQQV